MEDKRVMHQGFWRAHVPVTLHNRGLRFWYGIVNRDKQPKAVKTILTAMWSKTLLPFYLLPALLVFFAVLKSGAPAPKEPAKTLPVSVQLDTATLAPILKLLKTPTTAPADTLRPAKQGQ